MKYRVLDLINSVYIVREPGDGAYELSEATDLMAEKVSDAICRGRSLNLAIIDEDQRVHRYAAVSMFP